jgi:hypothetical protein
MAVNGTIYGQNGGVGAAFYAKPGSLGGGGIGVSISENPVTNPVGLNGYVRVGRGQAVVTRNAANTGDHILLASNSNLTDDTAIGDGDYRTVLLGAGVYIMGSPNLPNNDAFLYFGNATIDNPALRTDGANLRVVSGDNSKDAGLTAETLTATNAVVFPDGTSQKTAWTGNVGGGDFAESVDIAGPPAEYEPGDVLVIGNGGAFAKSAEPYSRLVAGVCPTKPGIVGRRTNDPEKLSKQIPMAVVGIVPIKVSTENGAIHPGDLLVTSSRLGYAMKGTDSSRMLGAIIGKSLGAIESGDGVIDALITLQ